MAPTIVTRAQWGARAPKSSIARITWGQRVGVAVHHSAGNASSTAAAIRSIQNFQMDSNGWVDIGYNWMVTQDGRLWEGRSGGWLAIGAHAGGQNTAWIGVCWLGHSGQDTPSPAALATVRWVVDEARRRAGRTLDVRGHGQVPGQATECPGSRLRAWIAAGLPIEEDDVSAEDVWSYDPGTVTKGAVRNPAWRHDAETNLTVQPGFALYDAWDRVHDVQLALAEVGATVAVLAGADVRTAVRAELDRAAVAERAERAAEQAELHSRLGGLAAALLAELGPALVAELGEAAGELSAAVVESAVARALARTSLTVAAGPEPA